MRRTTSTDIYGRDGACISHVESALIGICCFEFFFKLKDLGYKFSKFINERRRCRYLLRRYPRRRRLDPQRELYECHSVVDDGRFVFHSLTESLQSTRQCIKNLLRGCRDSFIEREGTSSFCLPLIQCNEEQNGKACQPTKVTVISEFRMTVAPKARTYLIIKTLT